MSYQGFEVSPSAGNPVELYQFALAPVGPGGSAHAVPAPPAAPGNLIVGNAILAGSWSLIEAADLLTGTYPPPTGYSFDGWPTAPSGEAELWNVYHGSIGGSGWFYRHGVFGPTHGLLPSTSYVVRAALVSFNDFQPRGISIPSPFGDSTLRIVEHPGPIPPPLAYGWIDTPAATDGAGALEIDVGWYNTIPSDANIIYLGALMIFDATGTPAGGGQPYGTGGLASFVPTVLNYTSADIDITYQGTLYQHVLIERQNFKSKQDGLSKAEVDVALDLNNPIAQQWFVSGHLPIAPVTCRILRVHANDLTEDAKPFFGQVIRTRIVGKKVILTLASVERLTERRIPRVFNQRLCNNFLGDQVCRVNLMAKSFTTGTVSAITTGGLVVTVPGAQTFADGQVADAALRASYYKDGVLVAANGDRGWIQGHAGDVLTLGDTIPSLDVGQAVIVQPGCDLLFKTCALKFNNTQNRRAMDLIPNRNPFVGSGLL